MDASPEKFDAHRHNPVQLTAWMNGHQERFHRSLKEECLDRMIFFGETMLRNAVQEYLEHYHAERTYQGLENRLSDPGDEVGRVDGDVICSKHLGGMLKYYYHDAA